MCVRLSQWDPNIRVFVGCAWVVALNDYGHLLPPATVHRIEQSLYTAAKGDLYRVGGVDDDNLYPCYSNPWMMRTIFHSWVGARMGDANLTRAGDTFAHQAYDLWRLHRTLSEFNSPTYSAVSMWALSLWSQYAPRGSVLTQYAPEMLRGSWDQIGQLYHATLRNVAGPWDRSYGYNMMQYASLIGALLWGVVGRERAPVPRQLLAMYHQEDYAFYPLIALAIPELARYLSPETRARLVAFPGEHVYTAQAFSPPFDAEPRNITTWMSEKVTIGAQTVRETEVGGPGQNSDQFAPAVIQWAMDPHQVGCVAHLATESSIAAVAGPGSLNISYPNATAAAGPVAFTFLFSGLDVRTKSNFTGLEGLPGLPMRITTNARSDYSIAYNADDSINDFPFYNVTYAMPEDFTGVPWISFQMV